MHQRPRPDLFWVRSAILSSAADLNPAQLVAETWRPRLVSDLVCDGLRPLPMPVTAITLAAARGCSSVVERHVANVNVEGSTPFTRF